MMNWSPFTCLGKRNLRGGVSGNRKEGCDAICVASDYNKALSFEQDHFHWLLYSATHHQRGPSIFKSYKLLQSIRVFRSTRHISPFRAVSEKPGQLYRYDGLYEVVFAYDENGQKVGTTVENIQGKMKQPYTFLLQRKDRGRLSKFFKKCIRKKRMAKVKLSFPKFPNSLLRKSAQC